MRLLGKNRLEIDIYLQEKFPDMKGFDLGADPFEEQEDEELEPVVDLSDFDFTKVPSFILERGFTKKTLKEANCGINYSGGLVIPVFDVLKRPIGWMIRQAPGREPRYLYKEGFHKGKTIYGLYNVSEPDFLCITEGALDTLWLRQHHFTSVALLGAQLSKTQESLLSRVHTNEFVICLDNDETGKNASESIGKVLSKYSPVSYLNLPNEFKDVQEVRDGNTLAELMANRSVFRRL